MLAIVQARTGLFAFPEPRRVYIVSIGTRDSIRLSASSSFSTFSPRESKLVACIIHPVREFLFSPVCCRGKERERVCVMYDAL